MTDLISQLILFTGALYYFISSFLTKNVVDKRSYCVVGWILLLSGFAVQHYVLYNTMAR